MIATTRILLLTFVSICAIISEVVAQDDPPSEKRNYGLYIGIDAILANIDLWSFQRNDLDLELHTDPEYGSDLSLSPLIGYRFGDIWRVELAYWKKDYFQGLRTSPSSAFSRGIYGAHIFTIRVKAEKNLFHQRLFVHPSLGVNYGTHDATLQATNSIDEFESTTIYHRQNFVALELGLGVRYEFHSRISVQLQSLILNGLDQIASVRYHVPKPSSSDFSLVESKGSTVAFMVGLQIKL